MLNYKDKDETLSIDMQVNIQSNIKIYSASVLDLMKNEWESVRKLVFIDSKVLFFWNEWLELENQQKNLTLLPMSVNEEVKNSKTLFNCIERMETWGTSRKNDMIVVVGGGALMDIVSLACNLYRRGIKIIKVPTTLLGYVDASIGIKTGINHLGRRNRLGTYYTNYDVVIDYNYINTLDIKLIREGLGEIFKIAVIKSSELFTLLETNSQHLLKAEFYKTNIGKKIINLSIFLMLEELHDNPTESTLKRCVDFGHTFSPLVEMESLQNDFYKSIPHGLAVGVDCIISCIISYKRGKFSELELNRVIKLAKNIGFEENHDLFQNVDLMWSSLVEMTKHRGGNQNIPLPLEIGKYFFLQDLNYDELSTATAFLKEMG
ncbi:MAG: hypothetical protein CBB97_11510 [Candidatus Endolissoclinum sp. TMED37]|nr:MAG: hypothetical protein CBB97_11510 [Candidatus Endolissoclinum sp. TMED37]|tara:strand:- start:960 stop:2087 length:1128 start_codon:yes stop_codon:yes gene_type:complete